MSDPRWPSAGEPMPRPSDAAPTILAQCPKCGESARVSARAAGKTAGCNRCGTKFVIAAPSATAIPGLSPGGARSTLAEVMASLPSPTASPVPDTGRPAWHAAPTPRRAAPPAPMPAAPMPSVPVPAVPMAPLPFAAAATSHLSQPVLSPPSDVWKDPASQAGMWAVIGAMVLVCLATIGVLVWNAIDERDYDWQVETSANKAGDPGDAGPVYPYVDEHTEPAAEAEANEPRR